MTFDASVAADKLADVQAAVVNRQALCLGGLDGALTPAERAGVRILFPLELQYMLAAEVADLATLRALAAAPGVQFVWKDNLNKLLTNEGRALTGSTAAASAGHTGAGVGVAVIDTNFDLLHPELGGSTTLPNTVVKRGRSRRRRRPGRSRAGGAGDGGQAGRQPISMPRYTRCRYAFSRSPWMATPKRSRS